MWWKIYFWLALIAFVIGVIHLFLLIPIHLDLNEWTRKIWEIVSILALYSYIFKKKVFKKTVWKYYFILILISGTVGITYNLITTQMVSYLVSNRQYALILVASYVVNIPALIAIYRLGFPAKKKKA